MVEGKDRDLSHSCSVYLKGAYWQYQRLIPGGKCGYQVPTIQMKAGEVGNRKENVVNVFIKDSDEKKALYLRIKLRNG